jgi:hypothetical protein
LDFLGISLAFSEFHQNPARIVLRGGIGSTGKEFSGILGIGLAKRREIGRGKLAL